ncbi:MAG: fibrinogen-binding adhesin SdrG C-terminal domain-containing protein, partial [Lactococcus lactis]|nr:fibrinogen-binding adhesin SdrG C-terminal domain-containing protein [Lactococcus lactis]
AKSETNTDTATNEVAKSETNTDTTTNEVAKSETNTDTTTQSDKNNTSSQNIDSVANNIQNMSTIEEKKEALTNYIADSTSISKDDAEAQVESLELDYNTIDENTLLGALALDYSNDKEATTTYATSPTSVRNISTPTTFSNLSATTLATEVPSKNVNNLITVNNQTLSEGLYEDGTIQAHDGENITYITDFSIDNAVKSGDTMTVQYDIHTVPSDLTESTNSVDIVDPSGEVIATGVFDNTNKTSTYTFTDYVDKYENVNARLILNSYIDKQQVPNEETINLNYSTANTPITKLVNIDYQDPIVQDASNIQSIFTNLDQANDTVEQTIYVNPLSLNANNTNVIIKSGGVYNDGGFYTGEGSTIIDDSTEIEIYKVSPNQSLPESNRIYDYNQYENVTNQFAVDKNYAPNMANIDFGNINSPYIIKVKSKYTPGADDSLAIQQGVRMETTNAYGNVSWAGYTNAIVDSYDQGGGDGTITPEKTYKIGDYVWEDVDKDGVQGTDVNEKPISNVLVTLTYPDGTSKSIRTDENGYYEFNNLYDGETYTVTFETPEGYTPTQVNVGDESLDSNGGSVTVTINGQDDMTLDSGFYKDDADSDA